MVAAVVVVPAAVLVTVAAAPAVVLLVCDITSGEGAAGLGAWVTTGELAIELVSVPDMVPAT